MFLIIFKKGYYNQCCKRENTQTMIDNWKSVLLKYVYIL